MESVWQTYQGVAVYPKLTSRARKTLIREAARRQVVRLKELQRSTAQVGASADRMRITDGLHKSGPFVKASSHSEEKDIKYTVHSLAQMMGGNSKHGRMCSDQMKLNFLTHE